MKNILKNWKTSLLGGGALSAGLYNYIQYPDQVKESALMVIIGLIGLFSKDFNITGISAKSEEKK